MSSIVPKVSWFVKEKMRKRFQKCRIEVDPKNWTTAEGVILSAKCSME